MFPVVLNLSAIPVLLVGQGERLERRRTQLKEAGAQHIVIFHPGEGRDPRLSVHERFEADASTGVYPSVGWGWHDIKIVLVAGLSYDDSKAIADYARAAGKLVNVEDMNELCDFYFTANLRRGDLLIAVSTSGASPALARRVRDKIADLFSEAWKDRTAEIAKCRRRWKNEGKSIQQVQELTDQLLAEKGWL